MKSGVKAIRVGRRGGGVKYSLVGGYTYMTMPTAVRLPYWSLACFRQEVSGLVTVPVIGV